MQSEGGLGEYTSGCGFAVFCGLGFQVHFQIDVLYIFIIFLLFGEDRFSYILFFLRFASSAKGRFLKFKINGKFVIDTELF